MAADDAGCSSSTSSSIDTGSKSRKLRRCTYFENGNVRICANVAEPELGKHPKIGPCESESQETWGFDLFPERREPDAQNPSFYQRGGRDNLDRIKCERNVYSCLQKSSLVKLMLSALKSVGCEIDMRRHISCELCNQHVTGGYDTELNQVIVCQNSARSKGKVQGVLSHEFIHMFDYCRAKMDFTDIKHLACTEIRAANLAHCSFLSAWIGGSASPFNIAKRHAECVKRKATASVIAVRRVSLSDARAVVDGVFEQCYSDLEPVGRRIRYGSKDMEMAYTERYLMGYVD